MMHLTPCFLEQIALRAGVSFVQVQLYCVLRAGFTKSHFQQDIVMDTTKPSTVQKSETDSLVRTMLLSPPPPADLFAAVNSNPTHQYKNSLNSTHYMLYHEEQPTQQKYEPYTYGFLTTMARIEGKMKRKKPMAVTFIGGSVTAAYCKEPGIGCWVKPVSEWLMEENPQVITDSPPRMLSCIEMFVPCWLCHGMTEVALQSSVAANCIYMHVHARCGLNGAASVSERRRHVTIFFVCWLASPDCERFAAKLRSIASQKSYPFALCSKIAHN